MRLVIEYRFVDEHGNVAAKGGAEISTDSTRRVKHGIEALQFGILNRLESLGVPTVLVNSKASVAGMNRLLDGENVKDTVK